MVQPKSLNHLDLGGDDHLKAADIHVACRIREGRLLSGLTQHQFSLLIGVTYQQAHKYERGLTRVSAGRLWMMSKVLSLPLEWFFEDPATAPGPATSNERERMRLEVIQSFNRISDEKLRRSLSRMARALAHS